jgi:hypothetical protein
MRILRFVIHALFYGPIPDLPEFTEDSATHDQAGREARHRAVRGDWTAAKKTLSDAGTDWDLRGRRVGMLAEAAATDGSWLQTWRETTPDDPDAVLIEAATWQIRAGRARGAASADQTSEQQFHAFHTQSARAAALTDRAMALALPGDPVPWARKLGTMFGDRDSRDRFDEIYAEGRRRDPHNFPLHVAAISLLCQKWGGSHERMFEAARDAATAAPPGSASVLLPLFAHIEYALVAFLWGDSGAKGLRAARSYFRRPDVRQELDAWVEKWRSGSPGPGSGGRQWVAIYYYLAGRRAEAKAVFDEVGPEVSASSAWAYLHGGDDYGYLRAWMWANRLDHW